MGSVWHILGGDRALVSFFMLAEQQRLRMTTQAPPPTLNARGTSASTRQSTQSALKLFAKFQQARSLQRYSLQPFSQLPAEVVCNTKVYEDFAYYMMHEYEIQAGRRQGVPLDSSTALPYLNTLLHLARNQHGET